MPVETPSLFSQVIQEHLELKRRNAELEGDMPLKSYEIEDPFENHPLFKTEEQARLEETMDGTEPAVEVTGATHALAGRGEPRAAPRSSPTWTTASGAARATSTGATSLSFSYVPCGGQAGGRHCSLPDLLGPQCRFSRARSRSRRRMDCL